MTASKVFPRREYELCETDLKMLMDAARTPVMMIGGVALNAQEASNNAWENIGRRMGFEYMTVQPIPGKHHRFFTAVPTETETERAEREAKEEAEATAARIQELKAKKAAIEFELRGLEGKDK